MTTTEQTRLAQIRRDQMKWEAISPAAVTWDNAFLLGLLDRQSQEMREMRKEIRNGRE